MGSSAFCLYETNFSLLLPCKCDVNSTQVKCQFLYKVTASWGFVHNILKLFHVESVAYSIADSEHIFHCDAKFSRWGSRPPTREFRIGDTNMLVSKNANSFVTPNKKT